MALTYEIIIGMMQKFGTVLTEHVGSDEVIEKKDRELADQEIHDRDLGWILESDVLVAEVTGPSLGVGYEIGRAIERGKPVLCLYDAGSEKPLSAMIAGCDKLIVKPYLKTTEVEGILEEFFTAQFPDRPY